MKVQTTTKVYEYIYNSILQGSLPQGAPISEGEIGNDLGVSRSPVREALKIMEGEGLIVHYPNRGTFVAEFTQRDVEEIFEIRIMLETYAARSACEHMGAAVAQELEDMLLGLTEDSETEAFLESNRTLHRMLMAYSGNKRMERMFRTLSAQLTIINYITSRDPGVLLMGRQQHLDIIRAVKARDADAAEKAVEKHLGDILVRTIKQLQYPLSKD